MCNRTLLKYAEVQRGMCIISYTVQKHPNVIRPYSDSVLNAVYVLQNINRKKNTIRKLKLVHVILIIAIVFWHCGNVTYPRHYINEDFQNISQMS